MQVKIIYKDGTEKTYGNVNFVGLKDGLLIICCDVTIDSHGNRTLYVSMDLIAGFQIPSYIY